MRSKFPCPNIKYPAANIVWTKAKFCARTIANLPARAKQRNFVLVQHVTPPTSAGSLGHQSCPTLVERTLQCSALLGATCVCCGLCLWRGLGGAASQTRIWTVFRLEPESKLKVWARLMHDCCLRDRALVSGVTCCVKTKTMCCFVRAEDICSRAFDIWTRKFGPHKKRP